MLKVAKCLRAALLIRSFAKKTKDTTKNPAEMKYLNVAEKNDAAKTIAGLLSDGRASRREGFSVYNKIYEFEANVRGKNCKMVMTSVSGHLLNFEFLSSYRNWRNVDPSALFDAPVRKACSEDYQPIKRTLEREIRSCGGLIIWTDCDREGENIGFEILDVCKAIKPNITVYRAVFSEITRMAVQRALQQLKQPDKRQSDAVDVRSELDLRTGAAITRFQTMRLQRLFPQKIANKLISYGSCQIPTLGFVVERYKEIDAFVSEPFWKIKVTHTLEDLTVEFNWARNRLFEKQACENYYRVCLANPQAKVESVIVKPKSKWRPTPLDTVELEKRGSRLLKIPAKEIMTIAEKLYTKGIISYPRTETNQFSKEIDLRSLVEQQTGHNNWGSFAERVKEWGPNPRNGNKTDQAHPPIHPTKLVTNLTGNEARVYELVCRHFLACVSKDATGSETIVKIDIAGEKFTATGLVIFERNYLDVYIYENWSAKQIHNYVEGQLFNPTEISMPEGATTPPSLLTEADLIALMEKHGIGTDATHAEHINTIKERGYIGVIDKGFLVPGVIGMGLYEGYDAMELALAKPMLRAEFEADLKKICLAEKDPKIVLQQQVVKYKEAYKQIMDKITAMDEKMGLRINETPTNSSQLGNTSGGGNGTNSSFENNPNRFQEIFKCPKCNIAPMALKSTRNINQFMISCLNFPDCKNAIWLAHECNEPTVLDETCANCGNEFKLLKVTFSVMRYKIMFNTPSGRYKTCLACDAKFRETFDINLENVKTVGAIVGIAGLNSNTTTRSSDNTTYEPPVASTNPARSSSITSNTNSRTNSGSSNNTTTARRNNKKSSGSENRTTAQKKRTVKKTATKTDTTNIRNFFTAATSSAQLDSLAELNNIDELFDDDFDTLILTTQNDIPPNRNSAANTEIEERLRNDIEAAFEDDEDWALDINTNTISNAASNSRAINENINDIAAAFEDDDNEDWANCIKNNVNVTSVANSVSNFQSRNITTNIVLNNIENSRISSPNETTQNENSNRDNISHATLYDDSFSEIFRTEIDFTNMPLGSAKRNESHNLEPEIKRPRLQERAVTTVPILNSATRAPMFVQDSSANINSSSNNYAWGSAAQTLQHGVKCTGCHREAKELSVKKDGPNKGRIFYVCPKDKQCNFFQWGDETATSTATDFGFRTEPSQNSTRGENLARSFNSENTKDSYSWGSGSQNVNWGSTAANTNKAPVKNNTTETTDHEIKCECGNKANSLTVRKDGPNKGRPFHCCAERNCNFFQWGDIDNQPSTSNAARAVNTTSASNSQNPKNDREPKKRKCGLCRQEGHTKQKCPRKAELDFFA